MVTTIANAKLNHLSFPSTDIAATVDFFTRQLGCTAVRHGNAAIVKRPGFDIVITDASEDPVEWHRDFHIGFELPTVEAVAALHDRFQAEGVDLRTKVFKHVRGSRFFCAAPGGLVCEINTRSDATDEYKDTFKN